MIAVAIFVIIIIFLKLLRDRFLVVIKKISQKSKNHIDDIIVDVLSTISWPFYIYIALYISTRFLVIVPEILDKILFFLFVIIIVYYAGKAAQKIIDHFINAHVEKREEKGNASVLKTLGVLLKVSLWILAFLFILANLGIEITPLIAGLGIGGIAIAFALQNILEDLFSSFSIYLDKPFREGDFIVIGKDMGIIKQIGLKTTRIQALEGQEIVVSNRELTSSRINNYKKMKKRRIVFTFGVEYKTPNSKLKKINEIVKKIIDKEKLTALDRVHFKEFGNSSLNYEVVYYLDSNDYNVYMDVQQSINFQLKEAFEKEGIVFAFPTQTVYLEKN